MEQLVIQIQSNEKRNLLKELAIQLGGIVSSTKRMPVEAKEIPLVQLSSSSLAKEWDSKEDEEWDNLLSQMSAIK
jgi:hypothetical protein